MQCLRFKKFYYEKCNLKLYLQTLYTYESSYKRTAANASATVVKSQESFLYFFFYFMYIISNECKYLLAMKFLHLHLNRIVLQYGLTVCYMAIYLWECLVFTKLAQQRLKLLKTFLTFLLYVHQLLRVYKNANLWFMNFSLIDIACMHVYCCRVEILL